MTTERVAVIGSGPAGLMAADVLSEAGIRVDVYEAMPSAGRKFLMAGKSGLNITNARFPDVLSDTYPGAGSRLVGALRKFGPEALQAWMAGLGAEPVEGSSGRIFPAQMKASPLLRAWLKRLHERGVTVHTRHKWEGWDQDGALILNSPEGRLVIEPAATVFALGGGSWARLGSDGSWAACFREAGVTVKDFLPSNCGFTVSWSDRMKSGFSGRPVKNVRASVEGKRRVESREEFTITSSGVESGAIYTLSLELRDILRSGGEGLIWIDLLPDLDTATIADRLKAPRGKQSMANHLRKVLKLSPEKRALLNELGDPRSFTDPSALADQLKSLPLRVTGTAALDQAISTAGGVDWSALDDEFMLRAMPGVFCAGEMIDWDAPTGGYLLTACFATGRAAGQGAVRWLNNRAAA